MKIVMTLLVRDEEDIIRTNIDFHLAQGVDFFIVMDNLSVDGTRDMLRDYERRGRLLYLLQRDDDYAQHRWVTDMARRASRDFGADWIINNDADEFWLAHNGDLKHALSTIDPGVGAAEAFRFNFLPVAELGDRFFPEAMTVRQRVATNALGKVLPSKVCHRSAPHVEIDQGNHSVCVDGYDVATQPAPIDILHFPMRSLSQFTNKIAKGGAAYARNTSLPPWAGETWRYLYRVLQAEGLSQYWDAVALDDARREAGLADGTYVRDDRLKTFLAQMPLPRD